MKPRRKGMSGREFEAAMTAMSPLGYTAQPAQAVEKRSAIEDHEQLDLFAAAQAVEKRRKGARR